MTSEAQLASIKVLFFGRLKDVVGEAERTVPLAAGVSMDTLFSTLSAEHSDLRNYRSSVVPSLNQEFVTWDTVLHPGDEVAFLPPVSGG